MLPFAWSEDFTCDHEAMPPVTGIHILLKETSDFPGPIHFFFAFLIVPAALGFLVRRTWKPWLRLAGEVVAGLVGMAGAVMCMMLMGYGRHEQPLVYPAAWVGTISAWIIALEAWWASGEALRRGIVLRRARQAMVARIVAGDPAPVRIAAVGDPLAPEGAGDEEAEEALDDAPEARRRLRR
jgi:hypothetical protein